MPFSRERFKPKSTFNSNKRNAVIESFPSYLEERLPNIEIPSRKFNNFTKDDRNGMYGLKDDKSIINKGPDKVAAVIIWEIEDYLKEAIKQLEDKEVYLELLNDPIALLSIIFKPEKRKRGDLSHNTLNY